MIRSVNVHQASLQGKRYSNEDVECYLTNLSYRQHPFLPPIDLFIICDGHGGKEVANKVAPQLMKKFLAQLSFPTTYQSVCDIYDDIQRDVLNDKSCRGSVCGCTALVLLRFRNNDGTEGIQIVNLGDCRAVIARLGIAIPLCKDHKPFWSDEKSRIDRVNHQCNTKEIVHYDAGDWRIHDLSVCRSFGDFNATPQVTHCPESFIYPLQAADEFIIMACDGLWDVLENHEAVNFVKDHLHHNNIQYYDIPHKYPTKESLQSTDIAYKLATYAIARGSTDNVSIFIVVFNH